jgi:integrase
MSQAFGFHNPAERIPLAASVKRYLAYIRRFTSRTQQHYRMVIRKFTATCGDITIDQLSRGHVERYLDRLLLRASNRTANAHLTVVKSYCRWLAQNYNVANVAADVTMLREDPPEQRVLTKEEYAKVLIVCTDGEGETIRFLALTGIRATEATKVRWKDISADYKWLTVHGKGRKVRVVPLNATLRDILQKYRRKPDSSMEFLKSNRYQLYRLCKRLACRAKIPTFGPHSLRHFCATELYNSGVSVSLISKFLGHSSTQVTETVYIHFQYSSLDGITENLP